MWLTWLSPVLLPRVITEKRKGPVVTYWHNQRTTNVCICSGSNSTLKLMHVFCCILQVVVSTTKMATRASATLVSAASTVRSTWTTVRRSPAWTEARVMITLTNLSAHVFLDLWATCVRWTSTSAWTILAPTVEPAMTWSTISSATAQLDLLARIVVTTWMSVPPTPVTMVQRVQTRWDITNASVQGISMAKTANSVLQAQCGLEHTAALCHHQPPHCHLVLVPVRHRGHLEAVLSSQMTRSSLCSNYCWLPAWEWVFPFSL